MMDSTTPPAAAPDSFCLDGMNPQQAEAVRHEGGPLLIVAGAGTGKTRVLTHRIARLIAGGVPAGRMLAVTFTNKAAEEMKKRVEALVPGEGHQVWMHTFHSFGARLLRQHGKLLGLTPHFTIYDSDDQKRIIGKILKEAGLEGEKSKAGLYVSVISRAKDDLLDAKSYAIHAQAGADRFRQQAATIYERYQAELDKAGALDFGDLLLKTCELIREFEQVRAFYQEQFLHVLVDEYQDTNRAQYMLTKTLSAKHRNLCVVGDPDQSIYAWRGADVRNIMEFERDFKDAKVVVLEQNYRSTSRILTAASAVIERNRYRKPKSLWTAKQGGEPVGVRELPNEMEEAGWVMRRAQGYARTEGYSFKDMAVFYRTNAQSRNFEQAFREAGVPYRLLGSLRFYERKEVKDALAYARVVLNPSDGLNLARILNVPARGIGKTSEDKIHAFAAEHGLGLYEALGKEAQIPGLTPASRKGARELIGMFEKVRSELSHWSPSVAMTQILERSGYLQSLADDTENEKEAAARADNLQELVNALKSYEERHPEKTLAEYLESVALESGADGYDPSQPAVTLMTIHLAKGLEFPIVFVTGLEEGLFPIGAGNASADELEEERRLCYVAMTRAKERLHLSHASTRRIFGQTYGSLPSRFILEANLSEDTGAPVGALGSPEPKAEVRPVAPSGPASIKSGSRVKHPSFGRGLVLERSGSGETMKVTVRFDSGITKKLILRYAPLELL